MERLRLTINTLQKEKPEATSSYDRGRIFWEKGGLAGAAGADAGRDHREDPEDGEQHRGAAALAHGREDDERGPA